VTAAGAKPTRSESLVLATHSVPDRSNAIPAGSISSARKVKTAVLGATLPEVTN
jgi:hypothetical protein